MTAAPHTISQKFVGGEKMKFTLKGWSNENEANSAGKPLLETALHWKTRFSKEEKFISKCSKNVI